MNQPNFSLLKNLSAFLLLVFIISCKDSLTTGNNDVTFTSDAQVTAAVDSVYLGLAKFGNINGIFDAQEVSTDELMVPQRGVDWYDADQHVHAQTHKFVATDPYLNFSWVSCYAPIAKCNIVINHLPAYSATQAATLIPEIRAVRAYYYFQILDLFGNAPLFLNDPATTDEYISKDRATIYAFVESELKSVIGKLSKNKTYGKMNYWTAQALLARLYLNAEVYTGKANYAGAAAAANDVITNSPYKLEPDYFANFIAANENSNENIWVIPYDGITVTGFNVPFNTLDRGDTEQYNLHQQPWNGYCAIQDYYNSYDKSDKRLKNFIVGQQYTTPTGTKKIDVNYTPEVDELYPMTRHDAGARIGKFEIKFVNGTGESPNDFPLFRLAEMYLIRGEAAWRQNPGDANALSDINVSVKRAGLTPLISLSADAILAERGRELFVEMLHRQDLIRFGKYSIARRYAQSTDGDKGAKPADDDAIKRSVYPIPQPQIDANKVLRQNTGY